MASREPPDTTHSTADDGDDRHWQCPHCPDLVTSSPVPIVKHLLETSDELHGAPGTISAWPTATSAAITKSSLREPAEERIESELLDAGLLGRLEELDVDTPRLLDDHLREDVAEVSAMDLDLVAVLDRVEAAVREAAEVQVDLVEAVRTGRLVTPDDTTGDGRPEGFAGGTQELVRQAATVHHLDYEAQQVFEWLCARRRRGDKFGAPEMVNALADQGLSLPEIHQAIQRLNDRDLIEVESREDGEPAARYNGAPVEIEY